MSFRASGGQLRESRTATDSRFGLIIRRYDGTSRHVHPTPRSSTTELVTLIEFEDSSID